MRTVRDDVNPVLHRIFAAVIVVAALFVTWLGFFRPIEMDDKFTWARLPPLHARFVGALYLFGAVYVLGGAVSRHRARWWPVMTGIAIFTASMIVLTALNSEAFDMDLGPVKGWVASYVIYPPIAAAIAVWIGWRGGAPSGPTEVRPWVRSSLFVLAAVFGALGLALLVARDTMADVWPWPIDVGVAQFYGGPFITLAWVCGAHARAARAEEDLIFVEAGLVALAGAALGFSIHHRALFDNGDPAAWIWFVGLMVAIASQAVPLMERLAQVSQVKTGLTGHIGSAESGRAERI